MIHKAWCSIEHVPYCFSRTSIKFQGLTGWKIDDLNLIWVRLLDRAQLSIPSDLPCFLNFIWVDVLHNVRHKILTIFMMLKMFSCADLFSRPLCWRIYWLIMWFFVVLKISQKSPQGIFRDSDWKLCLQSGKSQGFFFQPTPWQPCICIIITAHNLWWPRWYWKHWKTR